MAAQNAALAPRISGRLYMGRLARVGERGVEVAIDAFIEPPSCSSAQGLSFQPPGLHFKCQCGPVPCGLDRSLRRQREAHIAILPDLDAELMPNLMPNLLTESPGALRCNGLRAGFAL